MLKFEYSAKPGQSLSGLQEALQDLQLEQTTDRRPCYEDREGYDRVGHVDAHRTGYHAHQNRGRGDDTEMRPGDWVHDGDRKPDHDKQQGVQNFLDPVPEHRQGFRLRLRNR